MYSLDLKGSEYFTIYLKDLEINETKQDTIENTSGSITWSLDSKSFFYSKLDKFHRPRQIFRHVLGNKVEQDELIFEEKDETFAELASVQMKSILLLNFDHITTEEYFFPTNSVEIKPKLFRKRKRDVRYS